MPGQWVEYNILKFSALPSGAGIVRAPVVGRREMEQIFPARQRVPANTNQLVDNGISRDPRAARDVMPGEKWVFLEHRTLTEIFAAERQP